MLALNRITYNGFSSVDLNLIIDCAFDSDSGETSSFLNREAVATDNYLGDYRRIHNFKYNEFFAPKFTFIKRDFSDFSASEYRRLVSWLTSKSTTSVLTAYRDASTSVEFEIIGGWTEIQAYKLANSRTVGVTAVFESVTPWALSPIKTVTRTINEPTIINVSCTTDDWESFIYPKITIKQSNNIAVNITSEMATGVFFNDNYIEGTVYHCDGTYYWKAPNDNGELVLHADTTPPQSWFTTSVLLYNESTDVKTYIKGNTANETIVIDGANKLVFTARNARKVLGNDFAWKWLPLKSGDNNIRVVGNCEITFEWREPIKLGEY